MSAEYSHRFCVAPMLDCTDRYARFLYRQLSKRALLYTEMVTANAILHGDITRLLGFDVIEHPVALQLGGSVPSDMAQCAERAQQWGYDEVNINVGCPSDRVQSGAFGACLMKTPEVVAQNVKAMVQAVDIPVTIKTRIAVDEQEPREALWNLVEQSAHAGCEVFIVHARKAWLQGLSPKQNRNVPPLDYEVVYALKEDFPELTVIINGGISTLDDCKQHLENVDGVMMGREVYQNPYILADVDAVLFAEHNTVPSRYEVLQTYVNYLLQSGETHAHAIGGQCKHAMGLFYAQAGGKVWRRYLSENAYRKHSTANVLHEAYQSMRSSINTIPKC